jgi:hypothetical protein
MSYLNDEVKKDVTRLIELAEERLKTLKGVMQSARDEEGDSDIRIAIDDVITPLSLASELMMTPNVKYTPVPVYIL